MYITSQVNRFPNGIYKYKKNFHFDNDCLLKIYYILREFPEIQPIKYPKTFPCSKVNFHKATNFTQ